MDRARILVTGASGFVGRNLIKALLAADERMRTAGREIKVIAPAGVDYVTVPDFSGPVDWTRVLEGVDRVVHAAGIAHAGTGRYPAALYQRVNAAATGELARAAARAGVKRFVFLSSIRAQTDANSERILTEKDLPQPTDDYGRSKLMAEAEIRASGVAHTILRPVVVYGPGAASNIATLLRLCALPVPLPLAAFTNRRSLLGIDNLIAAIRFGLDSPAAADETFIVADPQPLTLAEMVTAIRAGMRRAPALFPVPPSLIAAPLRLFGRQNLWDRLGGALVVDPAKLIGAGWRPVTDTHAGLAALGRAAKPAA